MHTTPTKLYSMRVNFQIVVITFFIFFTTVVEYIVSIKVQRRLSRSTAHRATYSTVDLPQTPSQAHQPASPGECKIYRIGICYRTPDRTLSSGSINNRLIAISYISGNHFLFSHWVICIELLNPGPLDPHPCTRYFGLKWGSQRTKCILNEERRTTPNRFVPMADYEMVVACKFEYLYNIAMDSVHAYASHSASCANSQRSVAHYFSSLKERAFRDGFLRLATKQDPLELTQPLHRVQVYLKLCLSQTSRWSVSKIPVDLSGVRALSYVVDWLIHALEFLRRPQIRLLESITEPGDAHAIQSSVQLFYQSYRGPASDFALLSRRFADLLSIVHQVRPSNSTGLVLEPNIREDVGRIVSTCSYAINNFNSALPCLKQESLLDWTSAAATFMHGTDRKIFTCIFRDCNYKRSNGFEHPWDLSRHLFLHHQMFLEPLGEGRHPEVWDEWEQSYLVQHTKEYLKLSWKDKHEHHNKLIARSVDWVQFPRLHTGTPQLSPRQIALSERSLFESLRSALLVKVRSAEIAAYLELKGLAIKLCIWLSVSNVQHGRILTPCMDEMLSGLRQLIRLIIQLDDRLNHLVSLVIKMRTEISDAGEEHFDDESFRSSRLGRVDRISSDIARAIRLARTLLQNFETRHGVFMDTVMVPAPSTSRSACTSSKPIPWGLARKPAQNLYEHNGSPSEFLKSSKETLLLIRDALNASETLRACLESQSWALPRLSASILKSGRSHKAYGHIGKPFSREWSEFRVSRHDVFDGKDLRVAKLTQSWSLPVLLQKVLSSLIRPFIRLRKFEYAPLNEATGEIRLLTVQYNKNLNRLSGTMSHHPLDEYGEYIALSYTWGGQKATETIIINDVPFSITPNLASALRSKAVLDASSASIPVWADAICINQEDVKERNRQVLRMRRIYGQARRTVIWLGTEASNSRDAFNLIHYLASRECKEETLPEYVRNPKFQNQWLALYHLFQRDWWTRVWIIQEAVVSRLTLTCGESIVDISNLSSLVYKLDTIITLLRRHNISHNADNRGMQRLRSLGFLRTWWENSCADTVPLDLLTVLATSRNSLASDQRDKSYGVLGLAVDGVKHVPMPDYSISLREAYGGLVKSFVSRNHDLDIICHAGSSAADPTLPSWVPDWSDDACGPSLCRSAWFAEGMPNDRDVQISMVIPPVFSKDLKRMTVWGYFIDNITGVSGVSGVSKFAQRIGNSKHPSNRHRAYADDEGIFQAIMSSLSATGERKNYSTAYVFRRKLSEICQRGYTYPLGEDRLARDPIYQWYQSNKYFEIEGRSLEYWINLRPTPQQVDCKPSGCPDINTFREALSKTMARRRLFTTATGYVGLAREGVERRDLLCIFPGCSVPVILRKYQQHFRFIGDAYVDGFMSGELKLTEEREIIKLRTFTLV